ncbi:MAG: SiaB family protein kinase [Bacteroidota bacterium]|nr:SiaB family protein kinase [Bacteroidota bacterium]
MYELFKHLREERIFLSYFGSFDDSITDKFTEISEYYLESSNELNRLKNKVSFLIAESFQNIVRHGVEKGQEKKAIKNHKDFFQINVFNERIVLSTANLIAHEEIENLGKNIDKINVLNLDELRDLYNDVLENKGFSKKGGAGLGLIEMARKSGLPIKYRFNSLTETHRQFFLSLEIIDKKERNDAKININSIVDLYSILINRNCLILYKGDMSREVLLPLVEILRTNFMADGIFSPEERRTIETLIELVKNASKHGKKSNSICEGVFSITETNGSFVVECGNYIEQDKVAFFKNKLDGIKELSLKGIDDTYSKEHADNISKSPQERVGIGLLEIAKTCSNNFTYEFSETEKGETFFSIKISL